MTLPSIAEYIDRWSLSPLTAHLAEPPWVMTQHAEAYVSSMITRLVGDYDVAGEIAIHRTATVEAGAIVKSPVIVGPRCLIAATAYLRGGIYMDEDCIIGPGAELKSSFMFKGSKLAHFNFVGDSILGSAVNLEAGSVIANYRNELSDRNIVITWGSRPIETRIDKFGALVGDRVRVGANAVIAPGAILAKDQIIPRLSLFDQRPPSAPRT